MNSEPMWGYCSHAEKKKRRKKEEGENVKLKTQHSSQSKHSLILIIPLIIVWTHTYSLEYFLENPWGGTREEDVAWKATTQNEWSSSEGQQA